MIFSMRALLGSSSLLVLLSGCGEKKRTASQLDVTVVDHTEVKRQSIGNCWLYALGSWFESMLKSSGSGDLNVSESYWTYWDLYEKLQNNWEISTDKSELNTSGSWARAKYLVLSYGWLEEKDFIGEEASITKSDAQLCAQNYLELQVKEGGTLAAGIERTPELLKTELNKAFSCNGRYLVDIDAAYAKRKLSDETLLKDRKSGEERTLSASLADWREVDNPSYSYWTQFEGKKLPSESELSRFKQLGLRMRKALNDHQPLVLTFYVSFNAPDAKGLFNLSTLSQNEDYGTTGGHIVVLHDYTVRNIPEVGTIGEGDLDEASKTLALQGEIEYLVAKNSWGSQRFDRPWIGNGYTRLSWDYLTKTYYDAEDDRFYPFLSSVVFPPGY